MDFQNYGRHVNSDFNLLINNYISCLQVAGPYLQQYDVYYKRLDPDGKGEIAAMSAAGFLKKSGLADDILGKVG